MLAKKNVKVLLIGADLRNPQIHKLIAKDRSVKGLSNYIYDQSLKFDDVLIKENHFDVVLSGNTTKPNRFTRFR